MALETHWPLDVDFSAVPSLQANGSTGVDGVDSPSGVVGRLEIVPDPAGRYGNVMCATMYETDVEVGGGVRSEVAQRGDEGADFAEYWYSFRFMLSADWPNFDFPFSIAQLHDTPDGDDGMVKTPNFIFCLANGHFRCLVPGPLPDENDTTVYAGSVGADRGVWHDVGIHAKWAKASANGFRECFFDGVPIYREHGIYTSYNDEVGPFFKLGLYHGLTLATGWGSRVAYFSNARIWAGAANHVDGMGRAQAQPRAVVMI